MTDDKEAGTPDTEPAPPPSSSLKVMGQTPLLTVFVKDGTISMAEEKRLALFRADADKRRKEDAADRMAARKNPLDGGAIMRTHEFQDAGDGREKVYVLLEFVNARGEPIYVGGEPTKCLADIFANEEGKLSLVIACPRCVQKGIPLGHSQLVINQANRSWHLDLVGAGDPIMWTEEGPTGAMVQRIYRSAGRVMESERITCPRDGWNCHIDKNKIWVGA